MKHAKHTPGPWCIDSTAETHFIGANQGDYTVAQVERIQEGPLERLTNEANARLIAAAPELLEALLYVANDDGCPPDVAEIVLAAIAKATGGSK